MQFTVRFRVKPNPEAQWFSKIFKVISIPPRLAGLALLDEVRRHLHFPQMPAALIGKEVPECAMRELSVTLSEEEAQASGHFEDSCEVDVAITSEGALNEFVTLEFVPVWENGEITSVRYEHQVHADEVIEWWKLAGYPLEWDAENQLLPGETGVVLESGSLKVPGGDTKLT